MSAVLVALTELQPCAILANGPPCTNAGVCSSVWIRLGFNASKGVTLIDEGIRAEFIAIVNYGIIGLIQLELGYAESADISNEEAMALYDKYAKEALELMLAKNHDYDEAWRSMRVSSYTDLILMKIYRTKQIESLAGNTLVSEGIDANYMDMINYSVFGLIKIEFEG